MKSSEQKTLIVITSEQTFLELVKASAPQLINLTQYSFLASSLRLAEILRAHNCTDCFLLKSALNYDIISFLRTVSLKDKL
ncbi:hypothetical protein AwWohl_06540 [Gammaproteobacteria bacterium]|nr:hypothetical protein AwWohl_06540 [Gammaproteobacteria bacterium]